MKIKTISYSRLVKTDDFENIRIEATIEIDSKKKVEEQFKKLKSWVDKKATKEQFKGF